MALEGVVKSFVAAKGYGFINCGEVDGDIYFARKDLPPELHSMNNDFFPLAGRSVQFLLAHAKDGKPQAKEVQVLAAEGEELVGEVKSYNAAKGYGFLTCTAIEIDVYFQKRDLPPGANPAVGTKIRFTPSSLPDGKIQAKSLVFSQGELPPAPRAGGVPAGQMRRTMPTAAPPAPMPMPMRRPVMGVDMGMGRSTGMRRSSTLPPPPMPMHMAMPMPAPMPMPFGGRMPPGAQPPLPEGTQMKGTIKSWTKGKGFGFIVVNGFPMDIYFKSEDEMVKGQEVAFVLKWSADGKPQASEIAVALQGGEDVVGAVKSFNPQKNFGFIKIPGYPKDVYFKAGDLPQELQDSLAAGGDPTGAQVQFVVKLTKDGKPQMQDGTAQMYQGEDGFAEEDYRAPPQPPALKRNAGAASNPPAKRQRLAAGRTPSAAPSFGSADDGERRHGVIKSFNPTKGFGFLNTSDVDGDVYVPKKNLLNVDPADLQAGVEVTFELKFAPDGKPQAANVEVLLGE